MKQLFNGINLHFIRNSKFNTACLAVILRQELNRKNVTLNALLARVLASGCQKYRNPEEINEKLDNMLGTALNIDVMKKGNEQLIEIFCETFDSDNYIKEAIDFINEILFYPLIKNNAFDKAKVENEKEKLKNNILSRIDDKKELAKQRLIEIMCENNPFGLYAGGYVEDIEKITPEVLFEHYKEVLKTSQIEILAMSNSSHKLITNKCYDIFYNLNNQLRKPLQLTPIPPMKKQTQEIKKVKESYKALNQGKLCIGIKSDIKPFAEDFFPLLLGNEILGGGGNSKLFLEIREKEKLCYYISSFVYRFSGIICIQSGVSEESFEKAIKLITKEFDNLKKGDFSINEVENAKKSLIKSILSTKDYNNGIMDFYLTNLLTGKRESIYKIIKIIAKTEKEDILKALKNAYIDTIYMMGAKE